MKSKKAILDFLKTVNAKDELHRMAIIGRCAEIRVKVNFSNSDNTLGLITLEDFNGWLCREEVNKGDVIYLKENETIGIVGSVGISSFTLAATIDAKDVLCLDKVSVTSNDYRSATEKEISRLQRAISLNGLAWDTQSGELVEPYTPHNNCFVKISILDNRIGYGVFKEFDAHDNAVMYCVKMVGQQVRFSLNEVVGNRHDFQYHNISTYDRNALVKELGNIGKKWNGHARRIEPVELRVSEGKKYFFIDDCYTIRTVTEKLKNKDKQRAIAGNYYKTEADAMEIREAIVDLRNRQFLRPETIKRKAGRPRKIDGE